MIKEQIKNWKLKIGNCRRGFTLIELLIVIAIIGVLAALLMANFVGVRQRARDAQRKSDLRQLQSALELYRSDNGTYPICNGTGCDQLSACGNVNGTANSLKTEKSTYMQTIPCDPNGSSYYNAGVYYYYSGDGSSYVLQSCLENTNDSQGTSTNGENSDLPVATITCLSNFYYYLPSP